MMYSAKGRTLAAGAAAMVLAVSGCDQTVIGGPGPVANDRGEMSDPLRDEAVMGSEDFDNLPVGEIGAADDDIDSF